MDGDILIHPYFMRVNRWPKPCWILAPEFFTLPRCSTSSDRRSPPPPTSSRTCGGFFDVAKLNQRLAELEAQMTGETFWNNQEAAQKVINETNDIRGKLEPLARFGKQVEDLQVMLELAAAEPEADAVEARSRDGRRTPKNCSPTSTRSS